MHETEPQPPDRNIFEEYVGLLSDRALLQDEFDKGLADSDIEQLYFDEIIALSRQIDEVLADDGLFDSLIAGGTKAATALEQLNNPVLVRRADPARLEEKREPHRLRLEVAAAFLDEYGVKTEEALRLRAATQAAGIRIVSQAAFIITPGRPEIDEHPTVPAADSTRQEQITPRAAILRVAATTVAAEVASDTDPAARGEHAHEKEPVLDDYFTMRDAAVLVAGLSRFMHVLERHGITLPQVDIALEDGGFTDARNILQLRTDAVAKMGNLLQDTKLLVRLLTDADIADPRVKLLLGLQESINHDNPERFKLIAELIEAEKILAVTVRTPPRSGPLIHHVDVYAPDITTADPRQTVDATMRPVQVSETEVGHHMYMIDIEHLTARLGPDDKALATLCVAGAVRIRQYADAAHLTNANESYPSSHLSSLLFVPGLQHAIVDARKNRLLDRHIQDTRAVTVQEAIVAVLYRNPLLKEFMSRNRDTVYRIVQAVYAAPAIEDAA